MGGGNGQTSIETILNKQKVDSARNSMYYNAAERIGYIQEGKLEPTSDWEKIVGYAMNKGQPTVVFIDEQGQMQAQLQTEADLSKYNSGQVRALLETMVAVDEMAQKIKANETNQEWLDNLAGAGTDLSLVANYVISPQTTTPNNWEQQGVLYLSNGQPFKISLDAEGKLQVTDQMFDPGLLDLPDSQRGRLMDAIGSITATIQAGTQSEEWELAAANYAAAKTPYYLEMDMNQVSMVPDTYNGDGSVATYRMEQGKIVAKESTAENITPEFLKTPPYTDIGDSTELLKQVAELIKDKKPYFLDIDPTGAVVVKEINAQSLIKYNTPVERKLDALGVGSVLSLFA
ncbi:hypothetical protein A6A04_13150 [Paramagnetospirillum marisnigri]|uniref:Uncharacterized protein n=1 Tax=Paramagnetospirillum marisnigri TaxID=1285242 RepID=A0A178MUA1_9PROT|nr:hypothetical protein A6A04_13150 [Paramagnetospirillum marisnigri]